MYQPAALNGQVGGDQVPGGPIIANIQAPGVPDHLAAARPIQQGAIQQAPGIPDHNAAGANPDQQGAIQQAPGIADYVAAVHQVQQGAIQVPGIPGQVAAAGNPDQQGAMQQAPGIPDHDAAGANPDQQGAIQQAPGIPDHGAAGANPEQQGAIQQAPGIANYVAAVPQVQQGAMQVPGIPGQVAVDHNRALAVVQALGGPGNLVALLNAALQGHLGPVQGLQGPVGLAPQAPAPQNLPEPALGVVNANGGHAALIAVPQVNNVAQVPGKKGFEEPRYRGVRAGQQVQKKRNQHTKEVANLIGHLAAVPRMQNQAYRGRGGRRNWINNNRPRPVNIQGAHNLPQNLGAAPVIQPVQAAEVQLAQAGNQAEYQAEGAAR